MDSLIGAELPLERQFDIQLQVIVDCGRDPNAYGRFARTHGKKLREIAHRFHRVHPKSIAYYEAKDMDSLVHQWTWRLIEDYRYYCNGFAPCTPGFIGPRSRCAFWSKSHSGWRAHEIVVHAGERVRPRNDVGHFVRIGLRRAMLKEMGKVYRDKHAIPELWDDAEALERAGGGYEARLEERVDAMEALEAIAAAKGNRRAVRRVRLAMEAE